MSLTLYRPGEATDRPVKLLVVMFNPSPREIVSVTCRFNPKLTSMTTVDTLILYGSKPDSNDLQILASVDRKDTNPRFLGSHIAKSFKLTGFFGFEDNKSELDLSWTMLPQDFVSRYLCTAEGADSDGRKVTSADVVEVSRPEPQVDKSTCDNEKLYDVEEIVEDLTEASIGAGESLDERLKNLENSLHTSAENASKKCLDELNETKKELKENIQSRFQNIKATTREDMNHITGALNDLHRSLNFSAENASKKCLDNLEKTKQEINETIQVKFQDIKTTTTQEMKTITDVLRNFQKSLNVSIEKAANTHLEKLNEAIEGMTQKIHGRFQELETTTSQSIINITGVLYDLQHSIQRLEQGQATQALAVKILGVRFKFDVSREFKGKYYLASKTANFDIVTADATCAAYGGYLAELDDEAEYDFVSNFIRSLGESIHFGVGVNDIDVEGSYRFYRSKKAITFSRWAPGEPANRKNGEHCAAIHPGVHGYFDAPCSFGAKFICEVQF